MSEKLSVLAPSPSKGFRFSLIDACAIALCGASTSYLYPQIGAESLLFPVVLGHFFLFCNVFRVRRNYELIWSLVFLMNFLAWWALGSIDWPSILLCQTPVTIAAIVFEIRSPEYHGIFSQDSIPSLDDKLASIS